MWSFSFSPHVLWDFFYFLKLEEMLLGGMTTVNFVLMTVCMYVFMVPCNGLASHLGCIPILSPVLLAYIP